MGFPIFLFFYFLTAKKFDGILLARIKITTDMKLHNNGNKDFGMFDDLASKESTPYLLYH